MAWSDKVVEGDPARKMLRIPIVCGATTCASEPGVFCRFLGSIRFGSVPVCTLFPSTLESYTFLETDTPDGWIQRCDACKEAA